MNNNTRIKTIIDQTVNTFIVQYNNERANNVTKTIFSINNRTLSPATEPDRAKHFCTVTELTNITRNLPNKISAGTDEIPTIVLKNLPLKILKDYTTIFNNAINHQYFPIAWKEAKVIPTHKKGKPPNELAGYRPISLTPNISKVFEATTSNAIEAHNRKENIIPDNQFGFRHKHSTTHAIHKLLSDVNHHLTNHEMVGATLIDLEKALTLF